MEGCTAPKASRKKTGTTVGFFVRLDTYERKRPIGAQLGSGLIDAPDAKPVTRRSLHRPE